MNQITLAIPVYNTSKYFLDVIKYSIDNDFVKEIVVNDDGSSEDDYSNLLKIVENIDTNKIKVYRNSQNLGAFKNKYATVEKCNTEWVYLLDSDNSPFENTYELLKSIDQEDPSICYSPEKLYCKSDNQSQFSTISDYNFNYDLIGIEESKDAILRKTKWFDWFINTGNYFFNKEFYLDSLKEGIDNYSRYRLEADTAGAFYFMLRNSGRFKVVSNLYHHHRLRDDSNWCACGEGSQISVDFFKNCILDLYD